MKGGELMVSKWHHMVVRLRMGSEVKFQAQHILGMLAWAIIFKASFAHHSNGNNASITALLHELKGIMYGKYSGWLA